MNDHTPNRNASLVDASDIALADYMRRVDTGEEIDRAEFLQSHPKSADELRDYFESIDEVEQIAGLALAATFYGSELTATMHTHTGSLEDLIKDDQPLRGSPAAPQQPGCFPRRFGRYRILRELGEGAMGAVYLADDTQLKRKVALKTPTFSGRKAADMIERFYIEAQLAATLRHPHICPVHDVGEIDGQHYITMAYIEGRTLAELVGSAKKLPERPVAAIIRKLARALNHAHGCGVIHRDLKPANIMLDRQNEPLVMDFGLARRLGTKDDARLTGSGALLGTPAYMAPEQADDSRDATGPKSDIYSLGVILFELLTGKLPFEGPVAIVLAQIVTQQAPPPFDFRTDVDPRLDAICRKMMAKRPEKRYGSMKEVANALNDYLKQSAQDSGVQQSTDVQDTELAAFLAAQTSQQSQAPSRYRKKPKTKAKPKSKPEAKAKPETKSKPVATESTPGAMSTGLGVGMLAERGKQFVAQKWQQIPIRAKRIAASAVLGVTILLGLVFLLRTSDGTVRIEVTGDDVEVLVDGNTIALKALKDGKLGQKKLKEGSHALSLRIGKADLKFDAESEEFTVKDGRVSVKVDGVEMTSEAFKIVRGRETVVTIAYEKTEVPPWTDPAGTGSVSLTLVKTFDTAVASTLFNEYAMAISPDDRWLVHSISAGRTMQRIDLTTNEVVELPFKSPTAVNSVAFSEDSTQLVAGTRTGDIQIFSLSGQAEPVKRPTRHAWVQQVAFCGDYVLALSNSSTKSKKRRESGSIERWRRGTWEPAGSIDCSDRAGRLGPVWFSADGERAGVPNADTVRIWDLTKRVASPVEFGKHLPVKFKANRELSSTWGVSGSPDDTRIVSWGYDDRVIVSDINTGKEELRPFDSGVDEDTAVPAAMFSPDGRWIVVTRATNVIGPAKPGQLIVRDSLTGAIAATGELPVVKKAASKYNPAIASKLVISRDGRTIITGGCNTPICVWKLEAVPAAPAGGGEWVNLLSGIDPADAAERGWAKTDGGWRVTNDKGLSVLPFVRRPRGHYRLQTTVQFPRVTGAGSVSGMSINLPVADHAVTLLVSGSKMDLRGTSAKKDLGKIVRGHSYRFDILVEPNGDEARIRVDIDSRRIIDWNGPIAALSPDNVWERWARQGDLNALGFMAFKGNPIFESLRLSEINGEWVSLFDGKTLAGWESDRENVWWRVAEDGMLEGKRPAGDDTNSRDIVGLERWLFSRQSFGDFSLRFEDSKEIGPIMNMPVVFRATKVDEKKARLVGGYQFHFPGGSVLASDRAVGSLYKVPVRHAPDSPLIKRASAESLKLAAESRKHGDWNHAEITVRGKSVVVTVNGIELLNTTVDRIDPGLIGFIAPIDGAVKIRNVHIKKLKGLKVATRAANATTVPIVPPAPLKENPAQRTAAAALLQRPGATLTVEVQGKKTVIKSGDKLPTQAFNVVEASLGMAMRKSLTGDDLANVARFPSLTSLNLVHARLTDNMLKQIGGLHNLTRLHIKDGDLSDKGLSELTGLTKLTHLALLSTTVKDADLQYLSGMQSLIWLNLRHTNVTGSNIDALAGLKSLSTLSVGGSNFTEKSAALASMKRMTQLDQLGIYGGLKLTDQETAGLQAALPDCIVTYVASASDEDVEEKTP